MPIGGPGAAGVARDAPSSGRVRAAIHLLSTVFAVLAALLIAAIMFSTAADVTVRQLTGSSIPGVVEYSEVLMVGLIFLGLAFAQRTGGHIGVDLFTERMPPRVAHLVRAVGLAIALAVIAVVTYQTLGVALRSFESREFRFGLVQVPIWPARLLIPIGLGALLLELAVSCYDEIVGFRRRAPIVRSVHPEVLGAPTLDDPRGGR